MQYVYFIPEKLITTIDVSLHAIDATHTTIDVSLHANRPRPRSQRRRQSEERR
jgi:hypothetical protein